MIIIYDYATVAPVFKIHHLDVVSLSVIYAKDADWPAWLNVNDVAAPEPALNVIPVVKVIFKVPVAELS